MKVIDIIELINGSRTMPDVAEELGLSKDTLRRRLNSINYKYDNSLKKTIYKGKESEKSHVDNLMISDLIPKKNEKKQKEVGKKSEKNQKIEVVNSDIKKKDIREMSKEKQSDFTELEILALKKLASKLDSNESKLFLELSFLPEFKESKKSSIVISKEIHECFEEFVKPYVNKRISKFSLIELALYEFMKKYGREQ
ncbi:hypothetical protein OCE52_25180 [Bacillus mobilis]|uniref:AsnC family protein n=1 Tax=Bacillus mobilis TaxID=2026190 RepID=UPI0021CF2F0C|nr:AsnC family protein [Bacillus mobilis]MCU5198089.1 hypothetical protein [Bacillus mobilis]